MHYVCRNVTELPEYMSVKIYVPANTEISAGEVFTANTLDTSIGGNLDVYQAQSITNAKDIPVIILNNSFETMLDGRRVDGNPDYTTYVSRAGEVITGIRLLNNIRFELGIENMANADDLEEAIVNGETISGTYLYPALNSTSLTWTDDFDDVNTNVYLYIESLKSMRIGGQFGAEFIQTLVARVKVADIVLLQIPNVTVDVEEGLKANDASTAAGEMVATIDITGGTSPYTTVFNTDEVEGADNASFVIDDSLIKVGTDALTEAKDYKISLKTTDSVGTEKITNVTITVAEE